MIFLAQEKVTHDVGVVKVGQKELHLHAEFVAFKFIRMVFAHEMIDPQKYD